MARTKRGAPRRSKGETEDGSKNMKRLKVASPRKSIGNEGKWKKVESDSDSDFDYNNLVKPMGPAAVNRAPVQADAVKPGRLPIGAYPMLKTRGGPACLYSAIAKLNDAQNES